MANVIQTMRSGGTLHPAEIMNFFASYLVATGGVLNKNGTAFKVEEIDTPDMIVKVNMGRAYIPQSDGLQAFPVWSHTDDANLAINSNGSGNGRKDAVVLYIDKSVSPPSYTVDDVAMLVIVEGTPNASPQAPSDADIQSAVGASNPFIRLANVTVGSGVTEILDANIEDTRLDAELKLYQPSIVGSKQDWVELTDGATIEVDLSKGNKFYVTLGGNRAITLKAPPTGKTWAGKTFEIRVLQDGTGSHLITSWFTGYTLKWSYGVEIPLTTTASKADKIGFEVLADGTTIDATIISQGH